MTNNNKNIIYFDDTHNVSEVVSELLESEASKPARELFNKNFKNQVQIFGENRTEIVSTGNMNFSQIYSNLGDLLMNFFNISGCIEWLNKRQMTVEDLWKYITNAMMCVHFMSIVQVELSQFLRLHKHKFNRRMFVNSVAVSAHGETRNGPSFMNFLDSELILLDENFERKFSLTFNACLVSLSEKRSNNKAMIWVDDIDSPVQFIECECDGYEMWTQLWNMLKPGLLEYLES